MKACLMKVNYDPRYTSSTFEDRFRVTSGIYSTTDKKNSKKIRERISIDFTSNEKKLTVRMAMANYFNIVFLWSRMKYYKDFS